MLLKIVTQYDIKAIGPIDLRLVSLYSNANE